MSYDDLASMNVFARDWCANKIAQVVCSTTGKKPIDLFNSEEFEQLKPLPAGVFDLPLWTVVKVHNDHHFVVGGNFYSVPTVHIGTEIQIRVGLKTVQAYANHLLIKTHVRNYGTGQWETDENDYHDSAKFYLKNTASVCIEKAKAIGQATETMIKKVLVEGTRTSLRKSHAILRLGEEYGNERLINH
jgi:hypothetical protein